MSLSKHKGKRDFFILKRKFNLTSQTDSFRLRDIFLEGFPRWSKVLAVFILFLINAIFFISIFLYVSYRLEQAEGKYVLLVPGEARASLSSDGKVVTIVEAGRSLFTIEEANAYLRSSGYGYNPKTFMRDAKARYGGDCFQEVALSHNMDRIVFSTGCMSGVAPQPWVGIYNRKAKEFSFLAGGAGRNFVWSSDDSTITYFAPRLLTGVFEKRVISSHDGEILKVESLEE